MTGSRFVLPGQLCRGGDFKWSSHKNVYVLASHSHVYMGNIYNTACRRQHPETILPGWIVGTAGARRYQPPKN